jgi:hypothetical protein
MGSKSKEMTLEFRNSVIYMTLFRIHNFFKLRMVDIIAAFNTVYLKMIKIYNWIKDGNAENGLTILNDSTRS